MSLGRAFAAGCALGWFLVVIEGAGRSGVAHAQASLELGAPAAGARVHAHGVGDHVRLEWRGEGAPLARECVAPCTFHLEAGRWRARYDELALEADVSVGRDLVVLEPRPRSDLELGLGIAFSLAALAVAASTVGADEGRCVRGEGCADWVPALLVPSAVVLLVGIVMTLDAGGELDVTRISAR